VRSIASTSLALPTDPRWERPSADVSSFSALQPGGLAQGPDEKFARFGFVWGFAPLSIGRGSAMAAVVSVNVTLLAESTRRVGTAWPGAGCNGWRADGNRPNGRIASNRSGAAMLHCTNT
jgi:hypothetical protein